MWGTGKKKASKGLSEGPRVMDTNTTPIFPFHDTHSTEENIKGHDWNSAAFLQGPVDLDVQTETSEPFSSGEQRQFSNV